MTVEALWTIYCEKNPVFGDEKAEITLTASGLKKLVFKTFEQGFKEGDSRGFDRGVRTVERLKKCESNSSMPPGFEDLFSNLSKKG